MVRVNDISTESGPLCWLGCGMPCVSACVYWPAVGLSGVYSSPYETVSGAESPL